jgi:hypothetical protein
LIWIYIYAPSFIYITGWSPLWLVAPHVVQLRTAGRWPGHFGSKKEWSPGLIFVPSRPPWVKSWGGLEPTRCSSDSCAWKPGVFPSVYLICFRDVYRPFCSDLFEHLWQKLLWPVFPVLM